MRGIKYLLSVLTLLAVSCSQNKIDFGDEILGSASPVYLKFSSENEIHLGDYFLNPGDIVSVELPDGLNYKFDKENSVVYVDGNMTAPYANMHIKTKEYEYDLILNSILKDEYTFEFDTKGTTYEDLKIKGTFNNWNLESNKLILEDGVYRTKLLLLPGQYQYVFVEKGKEFTDPNNPVKVSNGIGGFNSLLSYGDLNAEKPFITSFIKEGDVYVKSTADVNLFVYYKNKLINRSELKTGDSFDLNVNFNSEDNADVRIYAYSGRLAANDILLPVKNGEIQQNASNLNRHDLQSQVMYEVMVDRFYNGNKDNDEPLKDPDVKPMANYLGGDIKGISEKIKDGYFKNLGVNSLWITPIVQNPLTAYGEWNDGGVYSKFSGYHGYWPLETTKIDHRFGTDQELIEMLDLAHKNDISVVMDYVANHVHEDAKVIRDNPDWKTNLYLEDGSKNIALWDSQRLTTWFDTFLPTLDLENEVVVEAMTDTALFWLNKFELDGLRHDACKHIPLQYWRTLTSKIKNQIVLGKGRNIYQVGETYSGPELISSYVNSGMLHGQFDFNLYDQSLRSFAQRDESLSNLSLRLKESLNYYGSHHLMGNISGNHDKARVISFIDGSVSFDEDAKYAGWTRKIENKDEDAFNVLFQIIGFSASIPGVPVIYYGDEIALPGGNDPDNRRMMQFDNLSEAKIALRDKTSKLLNFRRSNMPLMYGDTKVLLASEDVLVILRSYLGDATIAVFNKGDQKEIEIELPFDYKENFRSLFGSSVSENANKLKVNISKAGFDILSSTAN